MTAEVKTARSRWRTHRQRNRSGSQRWPADLIVIGTHGRSGFSRLLFGSVAEGVVRIAQTPYY